MIIRLATIFDIYQIQLGKTYLNKIKVSYYVYRKFTKTLLDS